MRGESPGNAPMGGPETSLFRPSSGEWKIHTKKTEIYFEYLTIFSTRVNMQFIIS